MIFSTRSGRTTCGLCSLAMLFCLGDSTNAQITSNWVTSFASGSWFDPTRWDNGVPDAAGDTARISSAASRSVQINQEATIGQLDLLGLQQFNISGTGPLVFDRPGI